MSNESEIVALADGTLRVFFRSDGCVYKKIMYCDAVWDSEKNNYVYGTPVVTDVTANCATKMTAIKYSKTIDGAEAIMVSYPAHETLRADGKIWTFLIRDNNAMELAYTWDFPHYWEPTSYGYSNMCERPDGSIGIFCEGVNRYENPTIQEVCPGAVIGDDTTVSYPPYANRKDGSVLSCDDAIILRTEDNTTVYYTTDGTEPTTASRVYNGEIHLSNSTDETVAMTLKAMAVTQEKTPSRVLTYNYQVSKSNTVVADFENSSDYSVSGAGENSIANGSFSYKLPSGWPVYVSFSEASNFAMGNNSAVAFHISVPANAPQNHSITFALHEKNGGSYFVGDGNVYLVPDGATESNSITCNAKNATWYSRKMSIPAGFSGYVVIPESTLYTDTEPNRFTSQDTDDRLDMSNVDCVLFSHGNSLQNDIVETIDNITFACDKDDFIQSKLNKYLTVTPSITDGSNVISGTALTLTPNEAGCVIYYTTDGSNPTRSSNVYNDGIILESVQSGTVQVKALVTLDGNSDSEIITLGYTVGARNSVILDFENSSDYEVVNDGSSGTVVNGQLNYKVNRGWGQKVKFDPDTAFVSGSYSGYALHVSVPDDAPSDHSICVIATESTGAGYGLYPGRTVYLASDDRVTLTEVTVNGALNNGWTRHSVNIAPGFSGWLIVPADSVQNGGELRKSGYVSSTPDANGQLDLNTVCNIIFSHGNPDQQNSVVETVDNLTLVYNVGEFIDSKIVKTIADFADDYDAAGNVATDFGKGSRKALAAGTETYLYSGSPLTGLTGYTAEDSALVFYLDTTAATANTAVVKLAVNHEGSSRYALGAGKSYYLVDGDRKITTCSADVSQTITLPDNFKGWFAVPYSSFEPMLGWEAATNYTLDFTSVRNILFYTVTGDSSGIVFDQTGFTKDFDYFCANAPVYLKSDANCDGEINIIDLVVMKKVFAGIVHQQYLNNPYNSDINKDGVLNGQDLVLQRRTLLGDTSFADLLVTASVSNGSRVLIGTTVELSCENKVATIYYTTDGTDPTTGSTVYTAPIAVNSSMTIKAFAVSANAGNGAVSEFSYTAFSNTATVVDFASTDDYSISVDSANATTYNIVDGALHYKTRSGWPMYIKFTENGSFVTSTNSAIAFHISVPEDAPGAYPLTFALREKGGAGYYVGNGSVYLVSDSDSVSEITCNVQNYIWYARRMIIPAGFSGYVVVPTSTLYNDTVSQFKSVTDTNGKLDLGDVNYLMFSHGNGGFNDVYSTVDDITLIYDYKSFIAE